MAMLKVSIIIFGVFAVAAGQPFRARFDSKLTGRIVNGEAITIDQAPYQVSVQYDGEHLCGGSIISEEWVITAAHCTGADAQKYTIRVGSTEHANGGSVHQVTKVKVHSEYSLDFGMIPRNDIALMRVQKPFAFNKYVQPIELYNVDEEAVVGEMAVVTGWGWNGEYQPDDLHMVEIPVIDKSECYTDVTRVASGQICAAYPEGGKDACQGDSGGPMAINGRLAGIVSWGLGCADEGMPGAYTEVAYFRKWIKQNTGL